MPLGSRGSGTRSYRERRPERQGPDDVEGGGGGGGTPPTAPSSVTTAVPARTRLGWGGYQHAYTSAASYNTWKNWGFDGHKTTLGGAPYLPGFGNSQDMIGSSTLAMDVTVAPNNKYAYQKANEGGAVPSINGGNTGLSLAVKCKADSTMLGFMGIYLDDLAATTAYPLSTTTPPAGRTLRRNDQREPPWGDWFNDTIFTNVAASFGRMAAGSKFVGLDGLTFDIENRHAGKQWEAGTGYQLVQSTQYDDFGKPPSSHTVAELYAQVEERGYEAGVAIYTAWPACDIYIYGFGPPEGWAAVVFGGGTGSNLFDPLTKTRHQWFMGIMRAHADLNATGRIGFCDAFFYRGTAQVSGVSLVTALKWNTQGPLSWYSRNLPAAVRNHIMQYIEISPFHWAGAADTFYINTQEPEPTYTNYELVYTQWGMGGRRWEYTFEGFPAGIAAAGTMWGGHDNYNYPPGRTTATMNAKNTTNTYSTTAPALSATKSGSGSTRTLSGTASHAYGIHHVKAYIYPSGSPVEASMTFNKGGGSPTLGLTNSYMDWTLQLTGVATGNYAIVTAYSTLQQQKSVVVEL